MSDKELINNCINTYYEGCIESDPNKIKEAFDENAMISGYLPDGLHEMNLDEFAGFVDAQKPSPKEKGVRVPALQAYSHSASVGKRAFSFGKSWGSSSKNSCTSSQLTFSTGKSSPRKWLGL